MDRWGAARLPTTQNGTGERAREALRGSPRASERTDEVEALSVAAWRGEDSAVRRLAAGLLVSGCRPRSGDVLLYVSFGKTLHGLPLSLVLVLRGRGYICSFRRGRGRRSVNHGCFAVWC